MRINSQTRYTCIWLSCEYFKSFKKYVVSWVIHKSWKNPWIITTFFKCTTCLYKVVISVSERNQEWKPWSVHSRILQNSLWMPTLQPMVLFLYLLKCMVEFLWEVWKNKFDAVCIQILDIILCSFFLKYLEMKVWNQYFFIQFSPVNTIGDQPRCREREHITKSLVILLAIWRQFNWTIYINWKWVYFKDYFETQHRINLCIHRRSFIYIIYRIISIGIHKISCNKLVNLFI